MSHYCDRFSCPEWNHGQCFGGGCKWNPAPVENDPPETEDDEEAESEEEEGSEE